jgi:hypothetical protein
MSESWTELLLALAGIAALAAAFVFEGRRLCRTPAAVRRPDPAHRVDRPDREAAQYRASGALPPWRS